MATSVVEQVPNLQPVATSCMLLYRFGGSGLLMVYMIQCAVYVAMQLSYWKADGRRNYAYHLVPQAVEYGEGRIVLEPAGLNPPFRHHAAARTLLSQQRGKLQSPGSSTGSR
jgi:hypothetical protein